MHCSSPVTSLSHAWRSSSALIEKPLGAKALRSGTPTGCTWSTRAGRMCSSSHGRTSLLVQSSQSITARGEQHEHIRAAAVLSPMFISFTVIGSVKHMIRMSLEPPSGRTKRPIVCSLLLDVPTNQLFLANERPLRNRCPKMPKFKD